MVEADFLLPNPYLSHGLQSSRRVSFLRYTVACNCAIPAFQWGNFEILCDHLAANCPYGCHSIMLEGL